MNIDWIIRKEKDFNESDGILKDIRQQFADQLKCLDVRLEIHIQMLQELVDFYKKRADIESDYSKNIDKLVKQTMSRHKADKQNRRDIWPGFSTYSIWQTLLSTTRRQGRDHSILADLYASQIHLRITDLSEDYQRLYKRCKEMVIAHHNELIKVLTELQSSMKTYHMYHGEYLQMMNKLKQVEEQRVKLENNAGRLTLTRRFKNIEKQFEKRRLKTFESELKMVRSRNEYILTLQAANAAFNKHSNEDIHQLINMMDYGYHSTLSRAMMQHSSAEFNVIESQQGCLDHFNQRIRDLNQRSDKQAFVDANMNAFQPIKPFIFQKHKEDEDGQLNGDKLVQQDLIDRLSSINDRLHALKVENEEIYKTLEMTDGRLVDIVTQKDYDVSAMFQEDIEQIPQINPADRDRKKLDLIQTQDYHLNKFQAFQTTSNLIARLQAKSDCIEKALAAAQCAPPKNNYASIPLKPKKRKTLGSGGHVKLFGGTIEEYTEATGDEIPLIVRSCISAINLYGMHHQGVFRIPGSQPEINEFKNQFEMGKDPLLDKVTDINSVAGLLKLYFRELKESLFPNKLFNPLIDCITKHPFIGEDFTSSISNLRHLLTNNLTRPVIVLMRFLFSFLNHLSEFSDENMMDTYNLAICFGPTLMPVPPNYDQVVYQNHTNELIRNIIQYEELIFARDGGTMYERCFLPKVENVNRDLSMDLLSDEEDEHLALSEDDLDGMEAIALFNFDGRTDRELSFRKGDLLTVYEKVSNDWWEGAIGSKEGLLADKYISVRGRDVIDRTTIRSNDSAKQIAISSSDSGSGTSNINDRIQSEHSTQMDQLSTSHYSDVSKSSLSVPSLEMLDKSKEVEEAAEKMRRVSSGAIAQQQRKRLLNSGVLARECQENMWDANKSQSMHEETKTLRPSIIRNQTERSPNPNSRTDNPKFKVFKDFRRKSAEDILGSHNKQLNIIAPIAVEDHNTNGDLSQDINNALAKVMLEIDTLTENKKIEDSEHKNEEKPVDECLLVDDSKFGLFKRTPDLVIDLPITAHSQPSPPFSKLSTSACHIPTAAEVFASEEQSTIKKSCNLSPVSLGKSSSIANNDPSKPCSPIVTHRKQVISPTKVECVVRLNENSCGASEPGLTKACSAILRQHSSPPLHITPPPRSSSKIAMERFSEPTGCNFELKTSTQLSTINRSATNINTHYAEETPYIPANEEVMSSVVSATLPRSGLIKPAVKEKPPVMKKPIRSAELILRANPLGSISSPRKS